MTNHLREALRATKRAGDPNFPLAHQEQYARIAIAEAVLGIAQVVGLAVVLVGTAIIIASVVTA